MSLYFRSFALFGLCLFCVLIYRPAIADDSQNKAVILAYGDSLIAGYGLPPGQDFASQLERKLEETYGPVDVISAAVSGETTAGGVARIEWTLEELEQKPDVAIVALGGNDMLRGLPPEQTRQNLYHIVEKIADTGAHILLAGMRAPSNMGEEYTDHFNGIYPKLAKAYPNVELYDFFLEGVAGNPELNQKDGIHPNERGVAEIVWRITPDVVHILNSSKQPGIDNPL